MLLYYVVAFGLLLHTLFWGVGLAWWLTPRRWSRFWPVFAPLAGLALQSAVVWVGAYAGLAGTHVYARPAEVLPLGLLAFAAWKRRSAWWTDVRRLGAVWLAMVVAFGRLGTKLRHASNTSSHDGPAATGEPEIETTVSVNVKGGATDSARTTMPLLRSH